MAQQKFISRISRCPIPFDTSPATEISTKFSDISPELREVLAGAAGCSPHLKSLLEKQEGWIRDVINQNPETALNQMLTPQEFQAETELRQQLRICKQRVSLLVGLSDLAGVFSLKDVTTALTRFADFATTTAMKFHIGEEIRRKKLPEFNQDSDDSFGGLVALAMGKMGANELNYSSDIDLIMLFDESKFHASDYHDARASHIRSTRRMAATLSELTEDGYVFRTDLRLRPDPAVTPVCVAMEAAERYYESVGRTWERAAYIKARPCGGDIASGNAFLTRLRPFVWRKHLDFAAIQDAHDMRLRIRDHKGLHGDITLLDHNMKLGRGGIREIEFFTQTRQIIAGGRDVDLRMRETVDGLVALANKGWIPPNIAQTLSEHYRFHRTIEHRVQMFRDAQTHNLPKTEEEFDRLARMMGEGDTEKLKMQIHGALTEVHEIIEGFFAPEEKDTQTRALDERETEVIERWKTYPCLRSTRAHELFNRLKPDILNRLDNAAKPYEALIEFDNFLKGLPAGVQLFSLFDANPILIDLIIDIAATSPALSSYLGRNAQVLDAVIGGGFFEPWPEPSFLSESLTAILQAAPDYEAQLDSARRWMKEWHFRIGVHFLRGLITSHTASSQYSDLANVIIDALWPVVITNFGIKYGPPPGDGAIVVAMGSLGIQMLNPASDLDLIILYDPREEEFSSGKKLLNTKTYYARLTQAFLTALSAPMATGKLYEVDMRLRPSGRQGPVATSISSFTHYQKNDAWTWEHMALTRARVVTGAQSVTEKFYKTRHEILTTPRHPVDVKNEVHEMRKRIADAKPTRSAIDGKIGPGRLQDIELVAQAMALCSPRKTNSIPATAAEQLAIGVAVGWLSAAESQALTDAYELMLKLHCATKLLTDDVADEYQLGQGGKDFLLRETQMNTLQELMTATTTAAARSDDIITGLLQQPNPESKST